MRFQNSSRKPPALIVHERNRHWASVFRQNLPDHPVVETRIWDNLIDETHARPGSVLCIEAEFAKIDQTVAQIRQLRSRFRTIPLIAACQTTSETVRSVALECGAHAVVNSPVEVRRIVTSLKRHLERFVPPKMALEQQITDRLPWKNQSTKSLMDPRCAEAQQENRYGNA